jgi:uncharacterized protein (DUF4415 family)
MSLVKTRLEDMPPLSSSERKRLRVLAARPDSELDFSDTPELTEAQLDRAKRAVALPLKPAKVPVTLRLDRDVLAELKRRGPGYQTRANAILRAAVLA